MKVILKKDHMRDCSAVKQVKEGRWDSPWFMESIIEYKNKIGRGNGHHHWKRFRCNSTDCPAHGLVSINDIEVQIDKELKRR